MYALPALPYAHDALEPVLSKATLQTHHGKHHQRYVSVLNELAGNSKLPLEQLIAQAHEREDAKLFNNAAQAWNHAFLWESMAAAAKPPPADLGQAIGAAFGDLAGLRKEFVAKGAAHFGSGWVWLVAEAGSIKVVTTHDAQLPWLGSGQVPLLVCDVWEHAYYLDYRNERDRFLGAWFDRLANWSFASEQLASETSRYRYPLPA